MKAIKIKFFVLSVLLFVANPTFAQVPDGFSDFLPISDFPTPANQENLRAIVNIQLDHMGLNPGMNTLHLDEILDIKLKAFVKPDTRKYTILAFDKDKKEITTKLNKTEKESCIFAHVGLDWVNVICSDQFEFDPTAYDEERKKKATK